MSKQLYEEALADAKKLREVAEDNAKKSLIEAVTPRIRDLIERELLKESSIGGLDEIDDDFGAPGSVPPSGDLMTDIAGVSKPFGVPKSKKYTFDLDALAADPGGSPVGAPMFGGEEGGCSSGEDEYELTDSGASALAPVLGVGGLPSEESFPSRLNRFGESLDYLKYARTFLKESGAYEDAIGSLTEQLDNMYSYVQESVVDPRNKKLYETKLEFYFEKLKELQEQGMRNRRYRSLFNEADVSLKLTGLPDDVDLDSIGVELEELGDDMEGGDEEGGEEDLDMGDEEGGDEDLDMGDEEGGDEDMDLDMGDDEDMDMGGQGQQGGGQQQGGQQLESLLRRNSTVVEINENMLRREIVRMRKTRVLREARARRARALQEARLRARRRWLNEEAVPSTKGHGPGKTVKSFGGGKSDGDPWLDAELTLEMDDITAEELEMEMDGAEPTQQSQQRGRGQSMKQYRQGQQMKNQQMKQALQELDEQNPDEEETEQSQQLESYRRARYGARPNGASSRSAVTESNLRRRLQETNLFNAKLIYSNKILQNESLSRRQKAEIIEKLDEASTLREAKLVFESLTKAMAGTSRPLRENATRGVIGSSSMTTRPASTQLNEGFETDRWARLAGITK